MNGPNDYEAGFVRLWRGMCAMLPEPEHNYHFTEERGWHFDFAWPDVKLAVEIEGAGPRGLGRHQRPEGFRRDAEKYREAAKLGWRVLRYTGAEIRERPIQIIEEVADVLEELLATDQHG